MEVVVWFESFRIAFREMARHRMRSTLTMLGVIIGVGAIIAVVSISEGAKRRIQQQIARVGSNMILVVPGSTTQGGVHGGAGSASTLTLADLDAISRECSAVAHAAPVLRVVTQAVSDVANWTTAVVGTTPEYLDVRTWDVELGRRIEAREVDGAAKVCLIGKTVAELLFGNDDPIGQRIRVKGTPVRVVGVLAEKGQNPLGQDEDDTVIMPITTCFRHLTGDDMPRGFVVSATTERDTPRAMEQIKAVLRDRHRLRDDEPDDFTAKSIAEAAKAAESASEVMSALLISIAAISLLVGGIGIMNIMLVTVMERTREIGIRLALGATQRMILQQFMIEAASIAGVGGVLGVVFGVAGSRVITHFSGWTGVFSPLLLTAPFLFAVVIGVLFGLLPAQRAAKMNPVDSLRHE